MEKESDRISRNNAAASEDKTRGAGRVCVVSQKTACI